MLFANLLILGSMALGSEHIIVTDRRTSPRVAMGKIHRDSLFSYYVNVSATHQFGLVFNITPEDVSGFLALPGVLYVSENVPISIAEVTQMWHLDRVDQSFGMDGYYLPVSQNGSGVDLYVMDTGIYAQHESFNGRVQTGINTMVPGEPGNIDCNGHGTQVASIAAGLGFGIARGAEIIPVSIMGCDGQGTLMALANGVSWVLERMAYSGRPAIVNLSIQSAASESCDQLMRNLYEAGALVVVAGGNLGTTACNYSPAREPVVVSVGATSADDSRLYASNMGPCIDLYAPGDGITGAGITGPASSTVRYGTSMASPLVAGVAATLWQKYPNYTNTEIKNALYGMTETFPLSFSMDLDCAGELPGVKFLQTMAASGRPDTLNASAVLVTGALLVDDFLHWSPELYAIPLNGEICAMFTVQTTGENMKLIISTDVLPIGLVNFQNTYPDCKDLNARWYVIEIAADVVSVNDFQNTLVGTASRGTSTLNGHYYLIITPGVGIEFGTGDGMSVRNPEIQVTDANDFQTFDAFKYLSFTTASANNLLITNVQPCMQSPLQIDVTRDKLNAYFSWIPGSASPDSCCSFAFNFDRKGAVSMMAAEQSSNYLPNSYELIIFNNRVTLYKNGEWTSNKKLKMHRRRGMMTFKISVTSSRVALSLVKDGINEVIYQHHGITPRGAGRQFSLTSSVPRIFNEIRTQC